jgi:hypothetical protein
MGCRTVYAVGIPACPHCGVTEYADTEGGTVAKVSAEGGPTLYVAEGDPAPDDVAEGVRLVGPGAPSPDEPAEGPATDEPALVSVAEQRAAGVPPEETVTIADQKAGAVPGEPAVTPEPDPAVTGKSKTSAPAYPKPV